MRTNTIKAIPLVFVNGTCSVLINVPFLVNEMKCICLTALFLPIGNAVLPYSRNIIITSNLLPNIDNPIGYLTDSEFGGLDFQSTSSQSNIHYIFPVARPVSENYTFTVLDFTNTFSVLSFTANVFIEFIQH